MRHIVLDYLDDLSNHGAMVQTTLTWKLVDDTAAELGAQESARLKWRQAGRGVPPAWQIKIVQALLARGIPVALGDFELLEPTPGRIAEPSPSFHASESAEGAPGNNPAQEAA